MRVGAGGPRDHPTDSVQPVAVDGHRHVRVTFPKHAVRIVQRLGPSHVQVQHPQRLHVGVALLGRGRLFQFEGRGVAAHQRVADGVDAVVVGVGFVLIGFVPFKELPNVLLVGVLFVLFLAELGLECACTLGIVGEAWVLQRVPRWAVPFGVFFYRGSVVFVVFVVSLSSLSSLSSLISSIFGAGQGGHGGDLDQSVLGQGGWLVLVLFFLGGGLQHEQLFGHGGLCFGCESAPFQRQIFVFLLFLEQFGGGLAPVGGQPSRYNLVEAFVPYVLVLGNQIVQLSRVQRFPKRCPPGRRRAALGGGRHLR